MEEREEKQNARRTLAQGAADRSATTCGPRETQRASGGVKDVQEHDNAEELGRRGRPPSP